MIRAASEVNADKLIQYFSSSPDVSLISEEAMQINGRDSLHSLFRNAYSGLSHQVATMKEPSIKMLSGNYAVATVVGEFTGTAKNNSTFGGPIGWTLIFVRESDGWKILKCHQSIKPRA